MTLEQQLAYGLGKTPEEVASMTSAELVQVRDDLQRQIDQLNAWIAVLEAAHAVKTQPVGSREEPATMQHSPASPN